MVQETMDTSVYAIQLTDAAVAKVTEFLRQEEAGLALQISVRPGGCAGLRYQLFFTDTYAKVLAKELAVRAGGEATEDDDPETAAQRAALVTDGMSVLWFDTFAVLIDPKSGPYLHQARLDHRDTLNEAGFTIDNPNAKGSCACGDSIQ
ncbi:HesB/IscA family protein [Streptomyces anthocyanicus]|uniref:HesB/IscA family protein n=1 Tax=Streptomyces anthocyanicus TaxID=68174 RepID=UPI002F90B4FC|nr:iron-sulfur cluster insertion protein ErpA [Streptomyces anthocyanicus]